MNENSYMFLMTVVLALSMIGIIICFYYETIEIGICILFILFIITNNLDEIYNKLVNVNI